MGYIQRVKLLAALQKVIGSIPNRFDVSVEGSFNLKHIQFLLESRREMDSYESLNEARELIKYVKSFGTIVDVFRVISVKKKSDINLDKLGNHWTTSKEKAREFAINNQRNVPKPWYLLSGTINKRFIDWDRTMDQLINVPWEDELYINTQDLKKLNDLKISPLK